jgi:hypothetical protein
MKTKCDKCGWGFAVKYGWDNQCRCLREARLCKCHADCEEKK